MESTKFTFTDQEFINVINLMRKLSDSAQAESARLISITDRLDMGTFDSLGIVLFFVWLSDLFGISEDKVEEFINKNDFTILSVKNFVNAEHTKTYVYSTTGLNLYQTMLTKLSKGI